MLASAAVLCLTGQTIASEWRETGMFRSSPLIFAQADCSAAARRAASRTGGRVLAARADGRGGCEVTLLVPQEGGRPRRVVLNVPA